MEGEPPIPPIPNVMPLPSMIATGSAILPDGSPVVVITDAQTEHVITLTPVNARKAGIRLIGLAEQSVFNALLYESMCKNGSDPVDAFRMVQAFQAQCAEVLSGRKNSFNPDQTSP